jgi:hypothetical protein
VVTEERSVHQIDRALCEQDRKPEQKSNTATGWELQQDVKKSENLTKNKSLCLDQGRDLQLDRDPVLVDLAHRKIRWKPDRRWQQHSDQG